MFLEGVPSDFDGRYVLMIILPLSRILENGKLIDIVSKYKGNLQSCVLYTSAVAFTSRQNSFPKPINSLHIPDAIPTQPPTHQLTDLIANKTNYRQ